MPNWVECTLRIEGDPDRVGELRRDLFLPFKIHTVFERHYLSKVCFNTSLENTDMVIIYPLKRCASRTISDLFWGHEHITANHMITQIVGCNHDFDMHVASPHDRNTFAFQTRWSPPDKWVGWIAAKYLIDIELSFRNTAEDEAGYIRVIDNKISWYHSKYLEHRRHFYKNMEDMLEFEECHLADIDHADILIQADNWPKTKEEYLKKCLIKELPLKEYLLMLMF